MATQGGGGLVVLQAPPGVVPVRIRTPSGKTALYYATPGAGAPTLAPSSSAGSVASTAPAASSSSGAGGPQRPPPLPATERPTPSPEARSAPAPGEGGRPASRAGAPGGSSSSSECQAVGGAQPGAEVAEEAAEPQGAGDHDGGDGGEFEVGDSVYRHGELAAVVHVDHTVDPPGYTVRMAQSGQEVSCERGHLAPAQMSEQAGDEASQPAAPEQPAAADAAAAGFAQLQHFQQMQQAELMQNIQYMGPQEQAQQIQMLQNIQAAQQAQYLQQMQQLQMQQWQASQMQHQWPQQQHQQQHQQHQQHQQQQQQQPAQQDWSGYGYAQQQAQYGGFQGAGEQPQMQSYQTPWMDDPYAGYEQQQRPMQDEGHKNHALDALAQALDRAEVEALMGGRKRAVADDDDDLAFRSAMHMGGGGGDGGGAASMNFALQAASEALGAAASTRPYIDDSLQLMQKPGPAPAAQAPQRSSRRPPRRPTEESPAPAPAGGPDLEILRAAMPQHAPRGERRRDRDEREVSREASRPMVERPRPMVPPSLGAFDPSDMEVRSSRSRRASEAETSGFELDGPGACTFAGAGFAASSSSAPAPEEAPPYRQEAAACAPALPPAPAARDGGMSNPLIQDLLDNADWRCGPVALPSEDDDDELEMLARREMDEDDTLTLSKPPRPPVAACQAASAASRPSSSRPPTFGRNSPSGASDIEARASTPPQMQRMASTVSAFSAAVARAAPPPALPQATPSPPPQATPPQQPAAPALPAPPRRQRSASRPRPEVSLKQKLEKRDFIVDCILKDEVPSRAATPRGAGASTPRGATPNFAGAAPPRPAGRGASAARARVASCSETPTTPRARRGEGRSVPPASPRQHKGARSLNLLDANSAPRSEERERSCVAPLPQLGSKSARHQLSSRALVTSGSQSARSWKGKAAMTIYA